MLFIYTFSWFNDYPQLVEFFGIDSSENIESSPILERHVSRMHNLLYDAISQMERECHQFIASLIKLGIFHKNLGAQQVFIKVSAISFCTTCVRSTQCLIIDENLSPDCAQSVSFYSEVYITLEYFSNLIFY